jgi:hypothetical protein
MSRAGSSLLMTVLGLAVLQALILTLLGLATVGARSGADRLRLVAARAAAESAAAAALADWHASTAGVPVGGTAERRLAARGPGSPAATATVERLDATSWLVTGRAIAGPGAGPASALRVSALPAETLWSAFQAAWTAAGPVELEGARIDGIGALEPGPGCPAAALEAERALGSRLRPAIRTRDATSITADAATTLAGAPPIAAAGDAAFTPDLAGFDLDRLARLADTRAAGTIRPMPVADGPDCRVGVAGNWGDPTGPGAPCAGYAPLIATDGDLVVDGGIGQGALLVRGDLTLRGGTRFHGPVIATGSVRVEDAELHGALLSLALTPSRAEGYLRWDACALSRAFALSLGRPFRTSRRWRIPVP